MLVIFLSIFSIAMAQTTDDIKTFCFGKEVHLSEVKQSLNLLLIPKDNVLLRADDNCIDIATSVNRGNLFEKYLSKRYDLIKEVRTKREIDKREECRLNLKTTEKSKIEKSQLKIGEKNLINLNESLKSVSNTMEILLGPSQQGELSVGEVALKVICQLIGNDSAQLQFSFTSRNQALVKSEVQLKKGEWLNIASVLNELNEKNQNLGIPQTEFNQTNGKSEIIYEMQFK
jgi:hypothetical protein